MGREGGWAIPLRQASAGEGAGAAGGSRGRGGGGVGTPRVVSADPGLLGTFRQTRELHSGGALGRLQGRGLASVRPCSSPLSPSGVEPGPSLAPRKAGALSAVWHLLASPRVTDTAPSPSSAPAEAHLWSSKQGSRVPSDPSRAAFQQRGIKMRRKTENSPFGLLAPVLLTSGLIAAAVLLFSVGG